MKIQLLCRPVLITALTVLLLCGRGYSDTGEPVTVVFRYDDYSTVSRTDVETELINAFAGHHMICTFAVIPFVTSGDFHDPHLRPLLPLTPEKAELLKSAMRAGAVDVALHGYSHRTTHRRDIFFGYSEFVGLSYKRQVGKLEAGQQFLQQMLGIPIRIFVPPWDRYDRNTLAALEHTGFEAISADQRGPTVLGDQLELIPANCDLSRLRRTIEAVRTGRRANTPIVVLFHEFDFAEVDAHRAKTTFDGFVKLLDWQQEQQDVQVLSLSDLAARGSSPSPNPTNVPQQQSTQE